MGKTITLEKDKIAQVADKIQDFTKLASLLADRLTGKQVEKEARATIEELEDKDALPELTRQQKEACVKNMCMDRTSTFNMLKKMAARGRELENQLLQADIGTPVEKNASEEASDADQQWGRFNQLSI